MFQVIRRKKTKNIRQTSCKPNTVLRVSSESYFQHLQMKCLGFTFAFHCVPSLHAIGSVLNLFLLLPYLPFYFRERPIHFHFTTSVIRLTRKWKGSGNSGQTKAQERTHPRNEWKATLIQQIFGVATISSSWLQTSKATELMNQGVLVPIGVLGSSIHQMLEFSTAL